MKAIVCKTFGPPESLTLEEIPDPKPGKKEILVQVKAASVNFPDTLIIQGLYQFKPELPFTPGGDVAGEVIAVGEEVNHFQPGDAVFGSGIFGGYAEKVVLPASNCFKKPSGLDDGVAASFMIAYGTSLHALQDRARLQKGETLLVLGAAGGVGLAAVEIGKALGARVIAAASTDEKLKICQQYGATETINYTKEDLKKRVKELTDGRGADVIYDPVGGEYSEPALRAIAWKGRFLVIGFATGQIPQIRLNLPLLKGCEIVGVFWGSFAERNPRQNARNIQQLVEWHQEGKIQPHIYRRYTLAEVPQALMAIQNRKVTGKAVIDVS